MRLISALAILMPPNAPQKRASNRTEPWEDHISNDRSAACSQESVDTAALFLLDVFPSGIVVTIPASASTAAAATTAVSTFVVLIIITLIVFVFAATIDGLVLF